MNANRHDFKKPARPAGNLEERLSAWLRVACQLGAQRALCHLPYPLEFSLGEVTVRTPEDAFEWLPDGLIGFRTSLGAEEDVSLVAWSRPMALALVAGALGDIAGTLPPDRDLTAVEESLCEYLMQQLFANVLHETYPGRTPIPITVGNREPSTNWGRLFGSQESVLCCSLLVKGPMREQVWYWLVPPQGALEALARFARVADSPRESRQAHQIEALVRELPIEVAVSLGNIELSLSQLNSLQPGDLLILKQRTSEPLVASVDDRPKFKAWPGRVGSRLAVQVESLFG